MIKKSTKDSVSNIRDKILAVQLNFVITFGVWLLFIIWYRFFLDLNILFYSLRYSPSYSYSWLF